MPRDVMQELAAGQLNARDWRWHKVLRKWLQKDTREANAAAGPSLLDLTEGRPVGGVPQRIDDRSERGVYVFFDEKNWRRERREITLDYDHLHLATQVAPAASTSAYSAGNRAGSLSGMNGGPVGGSSTDQNAMTSPS